MRQFNSLLQNTPTNKVNKDTTIYKYQYKRVLLEKLIGI
jgi:hypothetical protein